MRSDERRFRGDYDEYRNEDRERNSDRKYGNPGRRDYRNFENRSGYGNPDNFNRNDRDRDRYSPNYSRQEYNAPYYDRIHEPREGRYGRQDYQYNYENQNSYGRERRYREDYRNNRYEDNQGYRKAREAGVGYHGANYDNPENSDSTRSRREEDYNRGRRFQAQRHKWDSHNVDTFNQEQIGMGRYQARGRTETLYGGKTELNNTRDHNPSPERDDRGFIARTGDRIRSYFQEEDERRGRNENWDRDRSKNWDRVGR